MTLIHFNMLVLFVCLSVLVSQLFVREKQLSHILFAVFCGSIAMTLAQRIGGESLGHYKYLVGMCAVATCNGYWLLSRTLFRGKSAINLHHWLLALAISLLVFIRQGYSFANSMEVITIASESAMTQVLTEVTVLLSSCIIVLSFWEGCRGFKEANQEEKLQRLLFLSAFGSAVIASKISNGVFANDIQAQQWVTASLILMMVIVTQILLYWRFNSNQARKAVPDHFSSSTYSEEEAQIAIKIKTLLIEKELFLQSSLKVGDLAKALNLPEYRVSRVLKEQMDAKNFNRFVNQLRVRHAEKLLLSSDKTHWPVLVVGLESGFASVGPFTRAFKELNGFTPNQFRQHHLNVVS